MTTSLQATSVKGSLIRCTLTSATSMSMIFTRPASWIWRRISRTGCRVTTAHHSLRSELSDSVQADLTAALMLAQRRNTWMSLR